MSKLRFLAGITATSLGLLGLAQTAQAGRSDAISSALSTPIGNVSATQDRGLCDDFGAQVKITVSGGTKSAKYTVWATGFGQSATTFTTDSAGGGTTTLHNVGVPSGGSVGTASILVSSGFYTTSVQTQISCSSGEGG